MSGIDSLPLEIYTNKIFPLFKDARTLYFFALTSTTACNIIREASQYRQDFTLAGVKIQFICDKTMPVMRCVFQILRIPVLENHPELFDTLAVARAAVEAEKKDPDDLVCLYKFASGLKGGKTQGEVRQYTSIIQAILPFDFQSSIVSLEDLGWALFKTTSPEQIDLAHLFLANSGSKHIPAKYDKIGLCDILKEAIKAGNLELAQVILSLPNAKDISEGQLMLALQNAISHAKNNQIELMELVLSHPNAPKMFGDVLQRALQFAFKKDNPKLVRKLIRIPKLPMPLEDNRDFGFIGLKTVLLKAKENSRTIAAVLHHPKSIELHEAFLYPAGKAIVTGEDVETLLQLEQMLTQRRTQKHFKPKVLATTFINLSAATQRFIYLMFCKKLGCPTGNIVKDGMIHFIKHPEYLHWFISMLNYSIADQEGD